MKRSDAVRLALLGAGASAFIAYDIYTTSGGDAEEVPADLYTSVEQCRSGGRYSGDQCAKAYADSSAIDAQKAVTYTKREDCEADFTSGGCHEVTANTAAPSGGYFAPTMAGFLVGALATSALRSEPVYRSCTDAANPGDCRSTSGGGGSAGGGAHFFTRSGFRVTPTGSGASASVSSAAFASAPRSATLSRGGFGARAAAASAHA
jgi:uncharacterized protein YgiB involved in biofilm formation